MFGFFYGWRRKAGCASLVMSAICIGGLVRSRAIMETFQFTIYGRNHSIILATEEISWTSIDARCDAKWGWESAILSDNQFTGLALGQTLGETAELKLHILKSYGLHPQMWIVPWWPFALLLTLLSACLILWPGPRKPDQPKPNGRT